jgi:hypothetical protein
VAGVATHAADDAGGVVLALGAVVLPVADLAAVLACLVLVVTEGTVEGGELAKLVTLELVLAFGDGSRLSHVSTSGKRGAGRDVTHSFDDVVDELLGLVDLFLRVGHDEAVEVLLLVARVGGIGAALALLDRALATDGNLGARLALHLLQGVATGSDKQANFMGKELSVSICIK